MPLTGVICVLIDKEAYNYSSHTETFRNRLHGFIQGQILQVTKCRDPIEVMPFFDFFFIPDNFYDNIR